MTDSKKYELMIWALTIFFTGFNSGIAIGIIIGGIIK